MTSLLILQHQRPDGEVDTYHLKSGRRYHLGRGSQCQVRILDLKLSRQHCAFEYADQGWMLVDLASTNGCSVDGVRVAGTCLLRAGSVVAAGSSTVQVARIGDTAEEPAPVPPPTPPTPVQTTPLPAEPAGQSARPAPRSERISDELEPQSALNRSDVPEPLERGIPSERPSTAPVPTLAPGPAEPAPIPLDHDVLATLPPGRHTPLPIPGPSAPAPAPTPADAPADGGSRTFYINLLGRRVGPLNKTQARELKTKELKGTLTPADLAAVEAEAALGPPAAAPEAPAGSPAATDEQRTYYVTLLGQRVGPLSRSQARELKARELRGVLTVAEIERLIAK